MADRRVGVLYSRQWHLTIHSSRSRFAARLNSGVRARMQLLYQTSSHSFAQLVCMTFDREGIKYFSSDSDPASSGLASPFVIRQCRIYLLNPEDWDTAVNWLRELGAFSAPAASSLRPQRKRPAWLIPLLGALVGGVVGAVLFSSGGL